MLGIGPVGPDRDLISQDLQEVPAFAIPAAKARRQARQLQPGIHADLTFANGPGFAAFGCGPRSRLSLAALSPAVLAVDGGLGQRFPGDAVRSALPASFGDIRDFGEAQKLDAQKLEQFRRLSPKCLRGGLGGSLRLLDVEVHFPHHHLPAQRHR